MFLSGENFSIRFLVSYYFRIQKFPPPPNTCAATAAMLMNVEEIYILGIHLCMK